MAYLAGIVLLILLFVVLHHFTELTLKEKIGVTVFLSLFIFGAYLFNKGNEARRLHLEKVLLDFTHDKTIVCDGTEVHNSEFSYSSGTQTFLGKKESAQNGRIISLDLCQ
ncbi:hypothetical protein ACFLR3_03000 [Campylobacterota bacterium]